jgi:hypothetical protein
VFPSRHPGKHMHTRSIMNRLREVGINVLGARNSALRNLIAEMPPPVVAKLLGFSDTCTQRHAELAAQPWARYAPQPPERQTRMSERLWFSRWSVMLSPPPRR